MPHRESESKPPQPGGDGERILTAGFAMLARIDQPGILAGLLPASRRPEVARTRGSFYDERTSAGTSEIRAQS